MNFARHPRHSTLLAAVAVAALILAPNGGAAQLPAAQPAPGPTAAPAPAPSSQPAPPSTAATPPAPAADSGTPSPAPAGPLAQLAWLRGCWRGSVNHREFREYWMPGQGDIMVGVGQVALDGRMSDYEYLRLESRDGAIVFSQFSGDRKEVAFRLATTTTDEKDSVFTFTNTVDAFPARLIYRRSGVDGWLYETVEGSLNGADKRVIYPLRRIDCETDEVIPK